METAKKITLNLKTTTYNIHLAAGLLNKISDYVNTNRKVMIITDEGVPKAYSEKVLESCPQGYLQIVKQGEGSKSLEVFKQLCQELLKQNFTRSDLIIGLGGGVVGDLAGFVAASYLRGLDFVNLPTTTLAQIDSSIGGKVAINLDGIKNVLGSFYQPKMVLIDPTTLETLPKRHFLNGLAEAIKAGLIYDSALFELFEQTNPLVNLEQIIYRSLLVKKAIVEQDEKERDLRKLLNFGHTIGHGIESYFQLKDLLHGEAIAYGMLPMLENENLKARVLQVYAKLGFPSKLNYDPAKVYALIEKDKKTNGNQITLVKVKEAGKGYLETVPTESLKAYL